MPEPKQCPECQFEANHSQSCSKYKEVGWNKSKQTEELRQRISTLLIDNDMPTKQVFINDIMNLIEEEKSHQKKMILKEIIEDIPLCRERITKCDCRNHDINNAVLDYLESLTIKEDE